MATSLQDLKRVHIIGICGTLMGAFAAYLKRQGVEVTGSDQNIYPPVSDLLHDHQIKVLSGYAPENISSLKIKPDLVVIGNVISRSNPEAAFVIDHQYPYTSLPEAMERFLLPSTKNIVVSGTHGKTTTSSLMAHVLHLCNLSPSYFIGGIPVDLPFSFHVSDSKGSARYFVLEGDEYDTAFWDKVPKFNHYLPDHVLLTSVEFDHADIYSDLEHVKRAFRGLLERIRPQGSLIACSDYSAVRELLQDARVPVTTYGAHAEYSPEYQVANVTNDARGLKFDVLYRSQKCEELSLQIPGTYNALNALAAWLQAKQMGIDLEQIKRALALFRGVKRRQEIRGEVRGVTVIDDFAHHPTAVRETLKGLRMKYPNRKLIAVFEPRSATSRRKVFQKDYADAFSEADETFISTPYDQTKISATDQFSSAQLVEDIQARGQKAEVFDQVDLGVALVSRAAHSGDVIAVLSNGGFGGFISKLLEKL